MQQRFGGNKDQINRSCCRLSVILLFNETLLFKGLMVLLILFHQKDWMKSVRPSTESPWSFCLCRNSVTVSYTTSCTSILHIILHVNMLDYWLTCYSVLPRIIDVLAAAVLVYVYWYCVYLYCLHCNFDYNVYNKSSKLNRIWSHRYLTSQTVGK